MALKGKGKQIAGKAPARGIAGSSATKRKGEELGNPSSSGGKRKKRSPGVLRFFDDAAAEADPDYEDDEDLEMEEEHAHTDDGKLVGSLGRVEKSHRFPFFVKEELSGDELEELIKDRYSHSTEYVIHNDDSVECDEKVSGANELKDAFIWKVKCTVGQERQMVFCLMQKYVELYILGAKVQIISVFAIEHVKGYVFVEADKLSDVIEACKGFCNVYSYRINLVPKSEIPNLLAVRNKSSVSEGAWVRMKNGKYKGDLAKVVAVDDGRKQVTVKLVPRVDLQDIAKKFGGGVSLKLAAVPPPRLISAHELETFRPHIEVKHDRKTGEVFEVLAGMMLKDGYLYKNVSIGSIIFFGVQPSSSELLMFSDATKRMDEDLNWISSIYSARKENTSTEISEKKKSVDVKNGYYLHDLVLFGRKNFGVIVSIEKDCFRILRGDIEGAEVVAVRTEDVKSSCADKMFTAVDWKGKTIGINDPVNVFLGPSKGREGVVKHMYKGTLFIQVENGTESSDFCCAKSKSCEKTSVSKDSRGSKFLKVKGKGEPNSSFLESTMQEDDRETNDARSSMRYRRSDTEQMFSIGQSLRIREGPLKGYLCRVVAIYRSDITVKLDSPVKLITVKDTFLAVPKAVSKRDNPSDRPDHFGIQEMLSTGIGDAENPWAYKVSSGNTIDDWGKKPCSSELGREADPWGNMVKMKTGGSGDNVDGWGQEIGANPCSSKETCAAEDVWGASSSCALEKAGTIGKNSDDWSKGALDVKTSERDGWEKSKLSGSEAGGEWDTGNGLQNKACPWDSKGKEKIHYQEDAWGKAAGSQDKSKDSSDVAAVGWTRSDNNASSWDNKGKGRLSLEEDACGKVVNLQVKCNDGWGAASKGCTPSSANLNCWDNPKTSSVSQSDDWFKADERTEAKIGGSCGVTLSSQGVGNETENWNKSSDFPDGTSSDNHDQGQTATWESGWQRNDDGRGPGHHGNNWNRQKNIDHGAGGSVGLDDGDEEGKWTASRGSGARGRGRACYGQSGGTKDDSFNQIQNWDKGHNATQTSNWTDKQTSGNEESPDQDDLRSKNKCFDGHRLSSWNNLAQEADTRTDAKSVDDGSNWEKEARTPKDSSSDCERFQTCKNSEWNNDGERETVSSGWQQSSFKDTSRDKTVEGVWDKPRADEPRNILKAAADICSWDGAARSDDKGICASLSKSSNWTDSQMINSNKVDAWDNKGIGTTADEDSWGKANNSQERKIDVADNWTGNSNQNDERSSLGGGNQSSSWDAAKKSLDQVDEWGKAKDSFAGKSDQWKGTSEMSAEPGAWNQTQFTNQSGNNNWNRPKSFGDEADNRLWSDGCNKSREGGHGFGRGRGRGWDNGDNRNNYGSNSNNWNRPMDGDRGCSWGGGRERGRNDETGGDRQSNWNSQSDSDGGRESSWGGGRGRGRNGETGGNRQGNWNSQSDSGGGRGSSWGGGRGRGRNSETGGDRQSIWNSRSDSGGGRGSSWGGGRGRGRNDETGGDRQSNWNSQSDSDGGRGSSWGRGRGRFGNRERNQDDNSRGPPNRDGGRQGRGRGWGNNYGNKFDGTRTSNDRGSWGPGRGSFSLVDSRDNRDNWASDEKKGWSNWSKDVVGKASNNDQEENNWGRTKDPGSSSHSVWDRSSTGTGDVSKAAESNTEFAQAAGDQGCSWDKAPGSWNPNNEKSGSKGGW